MKHAYPYQFKLVAALCIFLSIQACSPPKPGIYKDDQISSSKRSDFHDLNTNVLKYLKANSLKEVQLYMSKEMLDNAGNERLVELMSNRLTDNPYDIVEEYYVVTTKKGSDSLSASGTDVNRHMLKYAITAPEMYFAFLAPKQSDNKYMISLAYSKLSYGWKITRMALAEYTVNGKTGPELVKLAKDEYDKKYLVNAVDNMGLAIKGFSPSPFWKYPDSTANSTFYHELLDEANKKFRYPMTLSQLATRPMVLSITMQRNDTWSAPMVWYMTHIPIKDTTEVKKENVEIRKLLSKLLPGIDKDNKYVLYDAFNEFPTASRSVDRFEMTVK
ncbi:MAG TPA: hypothetical protein VFE53_11025 [Mucilaginibacter sp.]|jgi:hypothetical protein|nr:hypothetical protein [Mucilaginibacter sp.]